jgi:hypothetical protein
MTAAAILTEIQDLPTYLGCPDLADTLSWARAAAGPEDILVREDGTLAVLCGLFR